MMMSSILSDLVKAAILLSIGVGGGTVIQVLIKLASQSG
jgi:hypothetical protein